LVKKNNRIRNNPFINKIFGLINSFRKPFNYNLLLILQILNVFYYYLYDNGIWDIKKIINILFYLLSQISLFNYLFFQKITYRNHRSFKMLTQS